MLTKETIVERYNQITEEYEAWRRLPDDKKQLDTYFDENNQQDRVVPMIDTNLANSFFSLIQLVSVPNSQIENRAAKIVVIIEEFKEFFFDWFGKRLGGDLNTPPDGGKDFETAWNEIARYRTIHAVGTLEGIKQLEAQGASKESILRIYEFYDENGQPQNDLFAKERENPGSVIGPDHNPKEVAEFRTVSEAWKKRESATFEDIQIEEIEMRTIEDLGGIDPSSWQDTSEAPETIDELVLSETPARVKDIAKLKPAWCEEQMSNTGFPITGDFFHDCQAFIVEYIVDKGWNHPDERVQMKLKEKVALLKKAGQAPQAPARSQVDTYDGVGDLKLRICLMSDEGHKPATITYALQQKGETVTLEEVQQVVFGYEPQQAEAGDAPSVVDSMEAEEPPKKPAPRGSRKKKTVAKSQD